MQEPSDSSIGSQAVLSTIGVLAQGVVRFVYSVLVGNVFGRVVLGAVNSSISLALFASLLFPSAAASSATKYLAVARGSGDLPLGRRISAHLARHSLLTSCALGVVCAALAPSVLHVSVLQGLLTGLLVIAYSGYMFTRGILFGSGQVTRATAWDVLSSLLSLVALGAVLLGGASTWLLVPLTLGYTTYTAMNWPERMPGSLPRDLRREINAFLALTLVNSVAIGGFLQLSMVAAQHWDVKRAGYFAAALTLATPASLVSRSLSLVLFPSMAAAHGRGDADGARRQTDLATRALAVVSLATFGPLMLISPLLIRIVFRRPGFDEAAHLLPVLLAAVMVLNVVTGAVNALLSREHRHTRIVVVASVVGGLVGVVWWFVLAPGHGVGAVANGYLVGTLIVALVPVIAVWRMDRLRWAGLAVRFSVGCAVAGLGVWWVQSQTPPWWGQLGVAAVYALAWLGLSASDVRKVTGAARAR